MLELLKYLLSDFWIFIGGSILLNGLFYFTVNGVITIFKLFFRHLNIRKHGWPPNHLDADGDIHKFKNDK